MSKDTSSALSNFCRKDRYSPKFILKHYKVPKKKKYKVPEFFINSFVVKYIANSALLGLGQTVA